MGFQGGICTLCLEKHENCKTIEGDTKNVLRKLLPRIDFTIIRGPVICKNCAEMLIKCFDFKTKCLHTHNSVAPFVNKKMKVDVKHLGKSENITGTGVSEDQNICGFCMSLVKNVTVILLGVKEGDVMLEKMVRQCLPELNLNVIEKPVICTPCLGSLENCFHFVTNCFIAEEKIKKYCETLDRESKDKLDLTSVLEFSTRNVQSGVDGNLFDRIKVERQFCEDRKSPDVTQIDDGGDIIKLEEMFFDECEHDEDAKIKNESCMTVVEQKVNSAQFTPEIMLTLKEESNKLDFIKIEGLFCEESDTKQKEQSVVEIEDQNCLFNEEIEIKTDDHDFDRFEDSTVLPQSEVTTRLRRNQKGLTSNHAEHKMAPYIEETLANKNISVMYKCNSCLYLTKYKTYLKRHLLKHKDPSKVTMYKSDSSLYQAKQKTLHLPKHKDASEIKIYRCNSCLHQTKYKPNLKKHLLKHKDVSEVTIYNCDSCSFQTKHKESFSRHLLTHKDPSEVIMYKCNSCLYQTKYRESLTRHLLTHKDPSEVTMYGCEHCLFQTKHKDCLKKHLLNHKDPSEVTMFKCDACLYQTKFKTRLNMHLQMHKDPLEITVYRCDSCSYQSKFKDCLKSHLLKHKKVKLYKCDFCSYQVNRKGDLNKHSLKHKDPSEVTMYKCASCLYQTNRKNNLTLHLLKHKDPSEVTMYKCDCCSFQTKYKNDLKSHLLRHKNLSEIPIYKCDSCSYQAIYKKYLKEHLTRNHKNSRK